MTSVAGLVERQRLGFGQSQRQAGGVAGVILLDQILVDARRDRGRRDPRLLQHV